MTTSPLQEENLAELFPETWIEDAAYPALQPCSREDVIAAVSWCIEHRWKVLVVGRGHSFSTRFAVPGNVLTLVTLKRDRVSDPDPGDLAIEVEPGVPAAGLRQLVHDAGFRLAGWPKEYPGTVGGLICGGRGVQVRHLVLGVDIIDGRGRLLHYGGRVRKDVSGFDIAGLFAGSRGRLGWLERVFLRLTPLQAPDTGYRGGTTRTSDLPPEDINERVAKALDPAGVFLKQTG